MIKTKRCSIFQLFMLRLEPSAIAFDERLQYRSTVLLTCTNGRTPGFYAKAKDLDEEDRHSINSFGS